MIQLVTKVDDETAKALDELIASGEFSSRSDAVRAGINHLIDQSRRTKIAASILAGFAKVPETADELELARRASVSMIAEEPW
jgi:Arc/MetJ-type ribon-helix-helix transcriptional regulator